MSTVSANITKSEQRSPMMQRMRRVWSLVPRVQRYRLIIAAIIMALTSAASTAVALLLGSLVDRIQPGNNEADRALLYMAAAWILGFLALTYVVRELLNLARRTLVENSCCGIESPARFIPDERDTEMVKRYL